MHLPSCALYKYTRRFHPLCRKIFFVRQSNNCIINVQANPARGNLEQPFAAVFAKIKRRKKTISCGSETIEFTLVMCYRWGVYLLYLFHGRGRLFRINPNIGYSFANIRNKGAPCYKLSVQNTGENTVKLPFKLKDKD